MSLYTYARYWKLQADAVFTHATPVTATYYSILAETKNVKIQSIWNRVTWAVTQPTPLRCKVTIDGIPCIFTFANPVSNQGYYPLWVESSAMANQALDITERATNRAYLIQGKKVQVEIAITWAVTQPSLDARLKWEKLV